MFGSSNDESMTEIKIQLVEPSARKHRNSDRILSCQKNGRIVFGDAGKRMVGVDVDDFVLIGNVGGDAAIALLASVIADETDPDFLGAAINALGNTGSDEAIKILVDIVREKGNSRLRTRAVQALGNIGSPAAKAALLEILNTGSRNN